MCKLRFDYTDNRYRIGEVQPINLDESVKRTYEDKINAKYAKFCKRLNDFDSFIKVTVSSDGKKIIDGTLVTVPGMLDELREAGLN
jgi:hypothetical protein